MSTGTDIQAQAVSDAERPTTNVIDLPPQHATTLAEWCREHRALSDLITELERQRKTLMDDKIAPLVEELNVERVAGEGWTLANYPGGREDISAELLLKEGVGFDVIGKCTVKRTWNSWQVRATKQGKDETAK